MGPFARTDAARALEALLAARAGACPAAGAAAPPRSPTRSSSTTSMRS